MHKKLISILLLCAALANAHVEQEEETVTRTFKNDTDIAMNITIQRIGRWQKTVHGTVYRGQLEPADCLIIELGPKRTEQIDIPADCANEKGLIHMHGYTFKQPYTPVDQITPTDVVLEPKKPKVFKFIKKTVNNKAQYSVVEN